MPGQFLDLGEYVINFANVTYIKKEGRLLSTSFQVYFIAADKPLVIESHTAAGKVLAAWLEGNAQEKARDQGTHVRRRYKRTEISSQI